MLSGNQYIFLRPKKRSKEADDKKRAFNDYKVGRDVECESEICKRSHLPLL